MKVLFELRTLPWLLLALLIFALPACHHVLLNVEKASLPEVEGYTHTLAGVKAAIMRSTGDPRVSYIMEDAGPGLIRCQLQFKTQHKAWVDIPYSTDGYSIIYVKSEGLKYQSADEDWSETTISRHYNNWIRSLHNSIQVQLMKGAP